MQLLATDRNSRAFAGRVAEMASFVWKGHLAERGPVGRWRSTSSNQIQVSERYLRVCPH